MQINIVSILPYNEKYISRLKKIGEVKFFETFLGDPEISEKCRGAEILIVTPRLHLDIIPYLDRCKLICVQATGYDAINLAAAKEKGIAVCNVPNYASQEVAEDIFALMLNCAKRIKEGEKIIREGLWTKGISLEGVSLAGKTMGIFGLGNIGSKVAKMAQAFQMEVIVNTAHPDLGREKKEGITFVDLETLLKESDFLALCAPVTEETKFIFDASAFSKMKKTAIFINTARGLLAREEDLAEALNKGIIAYAGVDVFQKEPPGKDNPLLKCKNIILTPHSAWATGDSFEKLWEGCVENVEAFLRGEGRNRV